MADEPDLKYPLAPTDEWYGEANYKTTGGNLVEMTPEDFLSRVRPLDLDETSRENIDLLKDHIVSGRSLDPLQIYRDGSEDGRHRAHAARELGIKKIPVITWTEPRPTDQSNLPAVIDAAAAASRLALPPDDETRPTGKVGPKKKPFGSGVGTLMIRRMFPLIQAVQQGYEHLLTEEQKNDLREFLAQPTHEFFGFEKSGLESLKKELGISPDDMPGETSLSVIEGRKEKPLDEVSQSTLKRRLKAAKNELSDLTGMTVKRDVTNRMEKRIEDLGKEDPLLAKRLDSLVNQIYDLKELINPDTRFGPTWRTHPEQGPPPGDWETRWEDARGSEVLFGAPPRPPWLGTKNVGTLYEALNSLPGHIRGYTGEISPDEYSIAKALSRLSPDAIRAADRFLKLRDGKGLLDHTFPQTQTDTIIKVDPDLPRTDQETVQNRIRNILDPESQSYIQLVDEEPLQRISSKDTSIKQIAAIFKSPIFDLEEGSVNLDIGGGRFDLGTDYLRNKGVENLVFDKFNRSPEHNEEVLNRIREIGGTDSATVANTLNVIEEPEARKSVIQQSYDYTKEGGKVLFQIYEGSGTGVGRETTKGWQNNRKTSGYIPEIEGVFGEGNVQRKGNIIIAHVKTPPDTGMADGGLVDNLSNVSFDINDPFANPEEYEEANPYSLGILGLAASIAAGPFSPIVWGIRSLQAYNFAKSQGWLGEEEPQYTGPVNPQTHEIDVINVTEEEANPQFSQAQVSLAPAQGAESELGNPPPDPTVDPTFGSMGTPPSGSDGAGDGTGEGAASAAADSPAGSPWNTGGFVVKPLYDS